MSKVMARHPGEERLLRYADGELAPRESAEVRGHLEACWECRAELDVIQTAVAECIHYRKSVQQAQQPPAPWRDLSPGFAALDAEIARESSWWRSLWMAVAAPRIWMPAVAAGLAVVLVILPWLQETPAVQAAELLRKAAVAAAEAKPRPRRLQVRTKSKNFVRAANAASSELAPVARLFAAAHYDWADPLSAKAYLAWHGQLAAKTDEVTESGGDAFYEVRTRTRSGELTEATLKLRKADLQPVQGTFQFRNDEWVELSEAPAEPEAAIAAARVPPSTAVPATVSEASVADELRVLAALHRIGADLSDPIEIVRAGPAVAVKGFGLDPQRRTQIAQSLQGLANVNVQFVDDTALPPIVSGPVLTRSSNASTLKTQLANDVFDRYEGIMERAHALRRLSARFPEPQALSAAERATLRAMLRDHAQTLARYERELSSILKPVLPDGSPAPATGPASAEAILQKARNLERSLARLLADDPATLPAGVRAELDALEQLTRNFADSMGQ